MQEARCAAEITDVMHLALSRCQLEQFAAQALGKNRFTSLRLAPKEASGFAVDKQNENIFMTRRLSFETILVM